MTFKSFIGTALVVAASVGATWAFGTYQNKNLFAGNGTDASLFKNAKYIPGASTANAPMTDFENAAATAAPAVVHIKVMQRAGGNNSPFAQGGSPDGVDGMSYENSGDGGQGGEARMVASGSGVTISSDGYIVTNNHVVDKADKLMVTLNDKKDYEAEVVGTDPSTDLAVIKIKGDNFPFLNFANSDDVRIGQWVLAIGYPLNLETTVTSGIVSAKARNIGINGHNSDSPIESFIQTDAAVNPGNSGGALVNTDGNLVGINSAIASPTGSYAGYSYAIPSNLVRKVAGDIIKYGSSKRAYLGVTFGSDQMTEADRAKNNIPEGNGVYVMDVSKGSGADDAGIQKGDFITKINGATLQSGTEMVEKISSLHPGDIIDMTVVRNGQENNISVTLKASAGNVNRQLLQQRQPQQRDQQQEEPDDQ